MPPRSETEKPLPQNIDAEREVLGAILVAGLGEDNRDKQSAAIAAASEIVHSADFFHVHHQTIFRVMLRMAEAQQPIELVSLTEELHSAGELEQAGGSPYIASLYDGMPRMNNVKHYAQLVAEKARLRAIIHTAHHMQQAAFESGAVPGELLGTLDAFVKNSSNGHDSKKLIAVDVNDFLDMKLDPIDFVIEPILPVSNSAMIFSPTGAGKTYIMLYLNYSVAVGAPTCFGWNIPRPRPVVYIDGEMDQLTLQERAQEIANCFAPVRAEPGFMKIVTPDQQPKFPPRINTKDGRRRIEDHCQEGCLLTLDNLFTLCPGSDEKETEDWAVIQEWILHLRKKKIAVFMVQHSNRSGLSQYGTSKREVQLSCNIRLSVASDYSPEEGLRVGVNITKLRRRGIGGRFKAHWGQPFEITYKVVDGAAEFSTRPMLEIQKKRALELLQAGAHPREVMESTGLDRFVVYRLRSKLKNEGAAAAAE